MSRLAAARDAAIGAGCRVLSLPFRLAGSPALRPLSRLVIIKPGSLGDVLMATPTVRALRLCLPDAHIAFAVGTWSRPMVTGNRRLSEIIDLGRLGMGRHALEEYLATARLLRAGRFDVALVLDRSPLVTPLPLLAGITLRIGLDSDGRGFSLSRRVACPSGRHEVDLYLDVAREAGCDAADPRLEFFPADSDETTVTDILAALLSPRLDPRAPLVAIHPGGGINPGMSLLAKRWPTARFAELARRVQDELGAVVVLLGGPADRGVVDEVQGALPVPAVDLAGKLTWGQVGALLRRCSLLVANDTGAAHLSVAVGTRAVVVFGPTDPAQYGPYGGLGEAVSLGASCSPCFRRGRFPTCHNKGRCLGELEVAAVWAAVRRQYDGRRCTPRPLHVADGGG